MSRTTHDIVKVAIGILIDSRQQVLVALRPLHTPHGGLWEFPGGKFEADETAEQALKRELYEEIGIEVCHAQPLLCVRHDYAAMRVELNTWQVLQFTGEVNGREGQQIRWVNAQELVTLPFPEGNRQIVQCVQHLLL